MKKQYALRYLGPATICEDPETGLTWHVGGERTFDGTAWQESEPTIHVVDKKTMSRLLEDNDGGWAIEEVVETLPEEAPEPAVTTEEEQTDANP